LPVRQQHTYTHKIVAGALEVFLDRRLSQDDDRGLFQGVQDNVATMSVHRLVIQDTPAVDATVRDQAKIGYHTLLAHHSSLSIQHPFVHMFTREPRAEGR
jgi:alpha-mannosidase II